MVDVAFELPPELPPSIAAGVRGVFKTWVADERVEGILLIGKTSGRPPWDAPTDALVVASPETAAEGLSLRATSGHTWLRVGVTTYRAFLRRLVVPGEAAEKLALRQAFVVFDRNRRLADALRTLEPVLADLLPGARVAAAAEVAAALRQAEALLENGESRDAARALAGAGFGLVRLEMLNDGVWPTLAPLREPAPESPAWRLAEKIRGAGVGGARLAGAGAEATALFRRYLPAAAAVLFDYLIKKGGSATVVSVLESLGLNGIPAVDLALTAMEEYGLIRVGREERAVPPVCPA